MGAAPFAIEDVRPDFVIAAGYKWLLGPYGLGYLYAAPKWLNGDPIEFNWKNRSGSEDFSGLVNYRDTYQPGARRFDAGGSSNQVLLPMAIAATEQLLKWGVANIGQTLAQRTSYLRNEAMRMGIDCPKAEFSAPHMIGLRIPKDRIAALANRLTERGIFVSVRGAGVRVSPHLYNTDADLDCLLEELSRFKN
jgi:selenocysteine lyase/cysteine desulfurase